MFAVSPLGSGSPLLRVRALVVVLIVSMLGLLPAAPASADAALLRIAGGSRIDTAVAISQHAFPDGAERVFLARQDLFADALAAGTLTGGPTLLVPSCGPLPRTVLDEIRRLDPADIAALGGSAAICDEVLEEAASRVRAATFRLAGDSRFHTAVEISREGFPDGADTVYLTGAVDAPEALAAGALTDGPVLLVPSAGDPAPVIADEVDRLNPSQVIVLGDTATVPNATANEVAGGRSVRRIAGDDPIETATLIAEEFFPSPTATAHLVRSDVIADGVSAGPLTGGPVLFVPECGPLPGVVEDTIQALQITQIKVLGGVGAVCDDVANAAAAAGFGGPIYLTSDDTIIDEDASDIRDREANISGQRYRPAFSFSRPQFTGGGFVTFNLSRDFNRFRATVGLADHSPDSAHVSVRFIVDDQQVLFLPEFDVFETHEVDLDVDGALRLRIEIETNSSLARVALGHGRLLPSDAVDSVPTPDPGDPPASSVLNDGLRLEDDASSLDYDSADISGETYRPAFSFGRPGFTSGGYVTFDLGRDHARFRALLGITDDAPDGSSAAVRLLVDGREVAFYPALTVASAIPIDLDVTDALRLRIEIAPSRAEVRAAFGHARLLRPGAADPLG